MSNQLPDLAALVKQTPPLEPVTKSTITWETPGEIKSDLLPVLPLSTAMLPEPLRDWIIDTSHRMQCPTDFIAVTTVIMLSSVIGAGCAIRPKQRDTWKVVPNLWGGIIARPGKLKSPALSEPMNMLSRLEALAKTKFDQEQSAFDAEWQAYEASRAAIKDQMKQSAKGSSTKRGKDKPESASGMEDLKQRYANLKEPQKPGWQRFKTNDATIEKLSELLRENPRGLLVFRDELIGQLAAWDRSGHEQDRAFFLEAWNGYGSLTTDRIGRGTIHTENLCISLLGGIQPSKLLSYLYQAAQGNDNDGLVQRLQLMVYPDDITDWQFVDEYPNLSAKNAVFSIVEQLVSMDFARHGALLAEDEQFPAFRFTNEAQQVFNEWLTDLETNKLRQEEEPIILEHLSKYRSLMPSLALIFHLIDIASCGGAGQVSIKATELAVLWCQYLESHARRVYGQVVNIRSKAAANLANKIKAGKIDDLFTVRDIYIKGWTFLTDKEIVQDACYQLVQTHWLKKQLKLPTDLGGRGTTVYLINPQVRHG